MIKKTYSEAKFIEFYINPTLTFKVIFIFKKKTSMSRGLYRGQPCYACSIAFIFVGIIATFVIAYFIKREQRKKKDLNMNSKILISGACDGIGKELARLFARDYKCNIIVLDNNEKHSKDLCKRQIFEPFLNNV